MTALAPKVVTRGGGAAHRIRSVDGLRAVAVAAVIGYHVEAGPSGGFLGVDLFFVISGFVITRLLLRQKKAGTFSMGEFYAHRVRRLLPALLCVILAVQLWVWTADLTSMRSTVNAQSLAALFFCGNWYTIYADVDYWSVQPDSAPLNHLWSLAVEEQFYLVWPFLVVLLLGRSARLRTLAVVAGAGAVVSYALAAFHYMPSLPDRAYLGTDTRAGALCLGALCACLTAVFGSRVQQSSRSRWALPVLALLSGGVLAALWSHAAIDSSSLYDWQLPLAGLSAAVLIGALTLLERAPRDTGPHPLARLVLGCMTARPVVAVGSISYGLYLWHWPLWIYVHRTYPDWQLSSQQVVVCAASLAAAALSYRFVEAPARRVRLRSVLLSVAGASAVVGAFCLVTDPVLDTTPNDQGPVVSGVR